MKLYNTAVKAVYKNGVSKIFESIEEAASKTGLSVRTIKSRVLNNTISKDGIKFDFVDPTTRRAYKAKQSKSKGSKFELDIVNKLKEIGYSGCVTSRSESKNMDDKKIDIVDTRNELPVYIQAKNTANQPNYHKIRSECPLTDKPYIICWKKAGEHEEPLAILPLAYFYQLIKK